MQKSSLHNKSGKVINTARLSLDELKILASIMGFSSQMDIFHTDVLLTVEQETIFTERCEKYALGYPLDYLLEYIELDDICLQCTPDTLIPREETQEWVIRELQQRKGKKLYDLCIDIGTGTGYIALQLYKHFPYTSIVATDISDKALQIAKKNTARNKANINFFTANGIESPEIHWILEQSKNVLVLANLPYVPEADMNLKSQHNIAFEPDIAIFSGQDGLDAFRTIFPQIDVSPQINECMFELDPRNIRIAEQMCIYANWKTSVVRDMHDRERVLIISRRPDLSQPIIT